MTGADALAAFNAAAKLVKEGDFEAALKVELLPSFLYAFEGWTAKP